MSEYWITRLDVIYPLVLLIFMFSFVVLFGSILFCLDKEFKETIKDKIKYLKYVIAIFLISLCGVIFIPSSSYEYKKIKQMEDIEKIDRWYRETYLKETD